jgi:AraC-like DNA-binding protein
MVDAAMPLFNDGQHLATLLAGKVIHHRRTLEDWLRNEQIAAKCDPQVLREIITACQTVPVIPAARFRAACVLLEFSARTLEERIPKCLRSSSTELPLSVNKAREFMHAHATERITLPQVARRAGLSVQHFCEIFKRHTGMTFTQCLALERIERAKSLLQNEGIQVAEAAFACGFESISSFNRAFKRLTGATPTQYRLSALDMKRQLRERENT